MKKREIEIEIEKSYKKGYEIGTLDTLKDLCRLCFINLNAKENLKVIKIINYMRGYK